MNLNIRAGSLALMMAVVSLATMASANELSTESPGARANVLIRDVNATVAAYVDGGISRIIVVNHCGWDYEPHPMVVLDCFALTSHLGTNESVDLTPLMPMTTCIIVPPLNATVLPGRPSAIEAANRTRPRPLPTLPPMTVAPLSLTPAIKVPVHVGFVRIPTLELITNGPPVAKPFVIPEVNISSAIAAALPDQENATAIVPPMPAPPVDLPVKPMWINQSEPVSPTEPILLRPRVSLSLGP